MGCLRSFGVYGLRSKREVRLGSGMTATWMKDKNESLYMRFEGVRRVPRSLSVKPCSALAALSRENIA